MRRKEKPISKEICDIQTAREASSIAAAANSKRKNTNHNEKCCEISKYSREELFEQIQSVIDAGLHPEKFFRDLWDSVAGGETWCGEIVNKAADGSFYWVSTIIAPIPNEPGKHEQYIAIRHDITKRKLIEEKLRADEVLFDGILNSTAAQIVSGAYQSESGLSVYRQNINELKRAEEVFREKAELLEQTYDAVIIWRLDDGIISWNPSAEKLYGFTEREAIKKYTHELLKTVFPKPYSVFIANLRDRGKWEGELIHTTKDGREVIVESRFVTIKKSDGAVIVLETCRDITERRRFEAELSRVTQLSLVGELAAGLAHEIKNPLTGIKGVIDILLQRRAPDDDEREILGSVRYEIERIDETVRALLNQARPKPLEIKPASLTATIRRSVQFASHQNNLHRPNGGKTIIETVIPDEEVVVPHDSARLEDAVLNLILNALAATADKINGRIKVRLSLIERADAKCEALIEVSDNGSGISESNLKEIFAPFYTTTIGGTGLGLAAVKRIARAHGGSCEVSSVVGHGATFTLHIPINGTHQAVGI